MGHKIFVSYKYHDSNVKKITNDLWHVDTVRDYVDALESYLTNSSEHVYKGESDDEDLSKLSDDTIWEKLKDRIYDSTLTIVMISSNMKEWKQDRDQWIPWEISYSLKEVSRKNKSGNYVKSATNAMIAIVLPDKSGSYDYYLRSNTCCNETCRTLKTDFLFNIMKKNMFNIKQANKKTCDNNSTIYYGESSYIISIKWEDFVQDPESYIERAYKIQNSIEQYEIEYEV